MKQEPLLTKYSLFQNDSLEAKYIKMRDAFYFLLERTKERCSKYCDYRASQERYAGMCDEAIPGLIERRKKIEYSTNRVLSELKKIDELDSVELRIVSLDAYAKGLVENHFYALFMEILRGELNKRWVPFAEKLIPTSECYTSNSLK